MSSKLRDLATGAYFVVAQPAVNRSEIPSITPTGGSIARLYDASAGAAEALHS